MQEINIMRRLDQFFQEEDQQNLFASLGKKIEINNGWVTIKRKGKIQEQVQIFNDKNDKKRIRCKGDTIALSLDRDKENYYIDHLQLGDIKQGNYFISFRQKKENGITFYSGLKLKESSDQFRMLLTPNSFRLAINSPFIEENQNYFYKIENNEIITNITTDREKEDCLERFRYLENRYYMITGIITSNIPLLQDVIEHCYKQNHTKIYIKKAK